jgi:uncharacterized protein (TIGR00369 family)
MPERTTMTREEVEAFLDEVFPQRNQGRGPSWIEEVGPLFARVRLVHDARDLRPGGTISGPAMMGLADLALYVAILANIGPVALTVTTNLSFNFLRKPGPRDLVAECRILKLGRRLAVGEVALRSDGDPDIVCHATGTYAIPSRP